jgi:hypothetical protein
MWLELCLALSVIAILFQLMPSWGSNVLWAIDVRNWTRNAWIGVNASGVLALIAVRYLPDVVKRWRLRGEHNPMPNEE